MRNKFFNMAIIAWLAKNAEKREDTRLREAVVATSQVGMYSVYFIIR
jgi:hypothetical protein